jgi:hypothetical protein
MCIRKNVQTTFRTVVGTICLRLAQNTENGQSRATGMHAELVDGKTIGKVVELWVKTAGGFVPMSKAGGAPHTFTERDDAWFRSREGYLEVWESVALAEVAVHCVPFNQIVATSAGCIVIKNGWRTEQRGALVELPERKSTPTEEPKMQPRIPSMQPKPYGTRHVD